VSNTALAALRWGALTVTIGGFAVLIFLFVAFLPNPFGPILAALAAIFGGRWMWTWVNERAMDEAFKPEHTPADALDDWEARP